MAIQRPDKRLARSSRFLPIRIEERSLYDGRGDPVTFPLDRGSISTRVPGREYAAATVAIAIYFLRSGDQHPLVAHPTWRYPEYSGIFARHGADGGCGGNPMFKQSC